ncbi:DHHW motif protein [Frisingicoccus caecimuris]|uniref:DHHW motif protein n=2 Tax=Frisingicoccus caecimuris TaxID=1796636 RepID=A0A4R2LQH7_9FIRM|nr:DHHW motif protein [Frisingicoccus caecimuris]
MEKRRNRKKKKNYKYMKYKIYVFSAVLMLMAIIALIIPLRPKESKVEKRTLTKFPAFSVQSFLNGEFLNGVSTWYADTFPFREALLTGNTRYRGLYGIQDNQIHGSIQTADEVPAKRISLMDIVLPNIQQEMDSLQESIKERIETQRAADAANGGAKRRQITNVPEQVGSVYVADDTAFSLYGFTQEAANQYIDAVSALANKVSSDVTVYDIVVPISTGIYLDEKLQEELGCSDEQAAIQYIYDNMDKKVVTIDAFTALKNHSDEYLYFRTDHHWTALGAYYAYSQLMKEKGITPTSLGEYETMVFDDFIGTLYAASNQTPSLAENPDVVTAYIPLATNKMTYTDVDGNVVDYDIIYDVSDWNSDSKYNCFIAGDQPFEEIHNPNMNDGSSCVVIKESFGNAFVPFLVDHYENVYVVDYRYYPEGLTTLIQERNIKDVIFINNISAATTSSLVSNIMEIVNY